MGPLVFWLATYGHAQHNTGLISTVARPATTTDGFDLPREVPDPLDVLVISRATSAPTRSTTIETRMAEGLYRRRWRCRASGIRTSTGAGVLSTAVPSDIMLL